MKKAIFYLLVIIGLLSCIDTKNKKTISVINKDSLNIIAHEKVSINKMVETDNLDFNPNNSFIKKRRLIDTTVVLYFDDLSNVYNYKIIDTYYNLKTENGRDSILRKIKIYNKQDSLIQLIRPDMVIKPCYNMEKEWHLKVSRSFITGKNKDSTDFDQYYGEIVVADLNFDGLEDFATPVDNGADNGPHYAFYIQNSNHKFIYNKYLTDKVMWFPDKINDSLKQFTNTVPCGNFATEYSTFRYNTKTKKWRKIIDYFIDNQTGKVMK